MVRGASIGERRRATNVPGEFRALGVALAAIGVGLLMLGGAAGAPSGSSTLVSPPYHGGWTHSKTVGSAGCRSHATVPVPWRFNLSSGAATGSSRGQAGSCPGGGVHTASGVSGSDVFASVSAVLGLPRFHTTVGNVTVDVGGGANLWASATDGGTTRCTVPTETIYYSDTEWEWNYSPATQRYAHWAENYSYEIDGTWSNYSHHLASVPSPFPRTNTTYYSHDAYFAVYRSCYALIQATVVADVVLEDLTTGVSYFPSSLSSPGLVAEVGVLRSTYYGWSNSSYWDGPANASSTSPTSWSYGNVSLAAGATVYGSGGSFRSWGRGGVETLNYTETFNGTSLVFPGPFAPKDHYVLDVDLDADVAASNTWSYGRASFALDLAGGYGFDVSSVTLS